jgi:hypothetical protein
MLTLLTIACYSPVFAEGREVIIQDMQGTVRAQKALEATDAFGEVDFRMVTQRGLPANNGEVILQNVQTGATQTEVIVNGVASFSDLPPGVWKVASSNSDLIFSHVAIQSANKAALVAGAAAGGAVGAATVGGLTTGTVVAGTAVVGGVTAAAVSRSNKKSEPEQPVSRMR